MNTFDNTGKLPFAKIYIQLNNKRKHMHEKMEMKIPVISFSLDIVVANETPYMLQVKKMKSGTDFFPWNLDFVYVHRNEIILVFIYKIQRNDNNLAPVKKRI